LLVAAEVTLSVVLVIGAGLMVRSFAELRRIDVGFESKNILTARLSLPANEYPEAPAIADFYARLVSRVEGLPGVQSVGAVRLLPLTGTMGDWSISIEGRPMQPGDNPHGDWQVVTPGYFETMGLDLVEGRFLGPTDRADALPVVVVNETMANEYWPGEGALGKRFRMGGPEAPWFTIVGVVRDVRHSSVTEAPRTEMYHQHDQFRLATGFTPNAMTLVMRVAGDPLALVAPLRAELRAMDPNVPLADIASMEQVTSRALSEPRFITLLLGFFATAALALAAIGIYGVISYGVTQRTHEIGIRMALGADRHRVVRMILKSGAGAVMVGIAAGVAGSVLMTNVMERMLYGVSRLDAATFVAVPLILAAVAVVACLIPARRAAGVDPLVALRYD
jgi:putative ABC transport system permease protein